MQPLAVTLPAQPTAGLAAGHGNRWILVEEEARALQERLISKCEHSTSMERIPGLNSRAEGSEDSRGAKLCTKRAVLQAAHCSSQRKCLPLQPCDWKAEGEQEGMDRSHGTAETTAEVQAAHPVPHSFISLRVL